MGVYEADSGFCIGNGVYGGNTHGESVPWQLPGEGWWPEGS